MGLDSFFMKSLSEGLKEEELPKFEDPQPSLCGGMFSGHGCDGSFRGKVYAELIQEITGVSLYTNWLDNETVLLMARKFEEALQHEYYRYSYHAEDLEDLARVFRAFGDRGCGLHGWW